MDKSNVQGLVRAPYRYRRSRHLLFEVPVGADGKGFLGSILPRVCHGATDLLVPQSALLNVAFTAAGLASFGVDAKLIAELDLDFREGPVGISMGDEPHSLSDQATWWDSQDLESHLHLTVQIYARDAETLKDETDKVLAEAAVAGLIELLPRRIPDHEGSLRLDGAALPRAEGDTAAGAKVHFGYRDGLSQPEVAWKAEALDEGMRSRGVLHRREFLLGYSDPSASSSPNGGQAADYFRDSSYLVLRWMKQDVGAFENFLSTAAERLGPIDSLEDPREYVAAKMMGRWRDGTPLTLSPDRRNPILNCEPFTYQAADPHGHRCPFAAHIRIVNPRDQPLSNAEVVGVPRLIRRGMPYGPEWPSRQIEDDGIDRGIIGIFLCTSIVRQFYTILHWISHTDFSPSFSVERLHDQDILFGNRLVGRSSRTMSIPTPTGEKLVQGLPDFVHTRGTSFFLLPSMSTLRSMTK